jgi:hypothetical protein
MTAKKNVGEADGGESLLVALQQTLKKLDLSTRARRVLFDVVSADHARRRGKTLHIRPNDVELLRRAARVEPPLSYDRLRTRFARCGAVTAREVCVALGLPAQTPKLKSVVQCPRCGHCFGGGK